MPISKRLTIALSILLTFDAVLLAQDKEKPVSVIAFGSCARERREQPVWDDIIAKEPDLFLMIGDNHYADFWEKNGKIGMRPVENTARIREAYDALNAKPGFQKLKQRATLMATWDDHDYGANDMGNDFKLREESQKEFIRFFDFAKDDAINDQQGIYHSRVFGPEGKRVQIIMLDTRYHRDPLVKAKTRRRGKGPYTATDDTTTTVLGEAQWKWLEEQLGKKADVRVIASSIQAVADEHGWETWGNFPHERERLFKLIEETKANGVVMISGDRHLMEISCEKSRPSGYPFWDFTSSGLTQETETINESNRYRVGPVKREQNFGIIEIQWGAGSTETVINLFGHGQGGKVLMEQKIPLDSLQAGG